MAAAPNEIGACRCPVCNSPSARLRVSAKQLAYVVCNACQSQSFARSDRSDELLRARLASPPAPVATALVVATTAPAPEPVRTATHVQPAAHANTPSPAWGFASWNG